jgi:chaperonin GroES
VAVGKGKATEDGKVVPLELKAGDRILYGKYSGTEITTKEGEEYLIMKEEDVFAIVK